MRHSMIQRMLAANKGQLRYRMAELFEWKISPETGREYFNLLLGGGIRKSWPVWVPCSPNRSCQRPRMLS